MAEVQRGASSIWRKISRNRSEWTHGKRNFLNLKSRIYAFWSIQNMKTLVWFKSKEWKKSFLCSFKLNVRYNKNPISILSFSIFPNFFSFHKLQLIWASCQRHWILAAASQDQSCRWKQWMLCYLVHPKKSDHRGKIPFWQHCLLLHCLASYMPTGKTS